MFFKSHQTALFWPSCGSFVEGRPREELLINNKKIKKCFCGISYGNLWIMKDRRAGEGVGGPKKRKNWAPLFATENITNYVDRGRRKWKIGQNGGWRTEIAFWWSKLPPAIWKLKIINKGQSPVTSPAPPLPRSQRRRTLKVLNRGKKGS